MADMRSTSIEMHKHSNNNNGLLSSNALKVAQIETVIDPIDQDQQPPLAIDAMNFKQALFKTWSAGWPLSLSGLCTAGNSTIAHIIVVATGRKNYLPAIGLAYQWQLLTSSTAIATLFGTAIFAGNIIGRAKSDSTRAVALNGQVGGIVRSGLMLSMIMSMPVIAFHIFSASFFKAIGQDDSVANTAGDYLLGASWGIPAYFCFSMLRQFVLTAGYPKTVLIASVMDTALLGGISSLFVYGADGGMKGIGYAFSVANWTALLLFATYCVVSDRFKSYQLVNHQPCRDAIHNIKKVWCIGFPIGLQVASDLSLFTIIGAQAGRNSVTTLATNAVTDTFFLMMALTVIRFSHANAVLISREVGAKNIDAAKRLGYAGWFYGAIATVIVDICFIAGHTLLTDIVVRDKSTINQPLLQKLFLFNAMTALGDITSNMITGEARGYSYTITPSLINIFGRVLITLAIGYAFVESSENGIESFYIGRAIGFCLAAIGVCAVTAWKKHQVENNILIENNMLRE